MRSAIILGIILGLMMCFDLGGPINKVAYAFAVAGLARRIGRQPGSAATSWAAVMASGMVPPLAMALASTVLARKLFTPVERENGKAAWLLGASFISEGAIPFAAADPLRVIPASMVGGAVTGALCMLFAGRLLRSARRHLRLLRDQPDLGLPGRDRGRCARDRRSWSSAFKRFIAPKELAEAEANLEVGRRSGLNTRTRMPNAECWSQPSSTKGK